MELDGLQAAGRRRNVRGESRKKGDERRKENAVMKEGKDQVWIKEIS